MINRKMEPKFRIRNHFLFLTKLDNKITGVKINRAT